MKRRRSTPTSRRRPTAPEQAAALVAIGNRALWVDWMRRRPDINGPGADPREESQ